VRFDPQEVAKWLRAKYGHESRAPRKAPLSSRQAEDKASSAA
jgi:hypothetical protein